MHEDLLLQQLLRKKLHPAAEDWIDEHTNPAKVAKWDDGGSGLTLAQQRDLWRSAGPTSDGIIRPMTKNGALQYDYTLAEREAGVERVRTGLRRRLDPKMRRKVDDEDDDEEMESEEEDEDDEDRVMEDVMPAAKMPGDAVGEVRGLELGRNALPVEAVMRFVCMGVVPQR